MTHTDLSHSNRRHTLRHAQNR